MNWLILFGQSLLNVFQYILEVESDIKLWGFLRSSPKPGAVHTSFSHGFEYNPVMLGLPIFFPSNFFPFNSTVNL